MPGLYCKLHHTPYGCFSRDLYLARGSESHCGLTVSTTGARRRRHTDCLYCPPKGLHPGDLGRRCRKPTPPLVPGSAPSVGEPPLAATTSGARPAGACSPKSLACPGGRQLQERNYTSQNALRLRAPSVGRACARRQDVGPCAPDPAAAALHLRRPRAAILQPGSQSLSWDRLPRDSVLHKSEGARLSRARAACEDHPSSSPDCTAPPAPLEGCVLARTHEE